MKEKLLERISKNPHLPTPPAIAMQLIKESRKQNVSLPRISHLVSQDPALSSKILKTINSAFYGLPNSIGSITQAVNLLGPQAIRSLVLCFSLPSMVSRKSNDFIINHFWLSSLAGAVIARELSLREGYSDVDDDFVTALLRDVGIPILEQAFPDEYEQIQSKPPAVLARRLCALEVAHVGVNHAEVAEYLLNKWNLPEEITTPILFHHEPAPIGVHIPRIKTRAELLYFVSLVVQLIIVPGVTGIPRNVRNFAASHYEMTERQILDFLAPLKKKIEIFAFLMNQDIGTLPDFSEISMQATQKMVHLAISFGEEKALVFGKSQDYHQKLKRFEQIASDYRDRAERDGLTGIYNRAYFDKNLEKEFERCRKADSILGLIFIDLDGFKKVNDDFGHPVGDEVLKEVAQTIHIELEGRAVAARYGGDEFCVIVPDTSEAQLKDLAENIWQGINGLLVLHDQKDKKVAASVGAALCNPGLQSDSTPESLLASADVAMYSAKTMGKNRVALVSLFEE